jgi:hypothetical protein
MDRSLLQEKDFMKGAKDLVKHRVAGLGMDSAGNISFLPSETTFEGSLISDGDTAYMKSKNASVVFAAPADADVVIDAGESEEGFGRRRLLQMEDGGKRSYKNFTNHLVGGLGFLSEGNISITRGADATFQGPLNHTGQGLIEMTTDAHAKFTGKYQRGPRRSLMQADPDFMSGKADLVKHFVAGMGMKSAGNISFDLAVTTFIGSLLSDDLTAFMDSANASDLFLCLSDAV